MRIGTGRRTSAPRWRVLWGAALFGLAFGAGATAETNGLGGPGPGDVAAAPPGAEPRTGAAAGIDPWQSVSRMVGLLNLALLDPGVAASLVPDPWLDAFVLGALEVSAEESSTRLGEDGAPAWPIGPWSSAASLAESIEAVDPRAAGALYGALGSRLDPRCRAAGLSLRACDARIRLALGRLTSPAVAARVGGNVAIPVTRSQRDLARMGPEVVQASTRKLSAIERVVWPAR